VAVAAEEEDKKVFMISDLRFQIYISRNHLNKIIS
jgi:hypothetical protein